MSFLAGLLPSLIGIIPQVIGSLVGHGLIGGDQADEFADLIVDEAQSGRPGQASRVISMLPVDVQSSLFGGGLIGGRRRASRKGSRRPLTAYNRFVSVQRRKGYSMKEVGKLWRQKQGGRRASKKAPSRKRGGALIGGARRKKSIKRRSVKPRSRSVGRRRVAFRDPLEHLKYAADLHLPGAEDAIKDLQAYEGSDRAVASRARKRADLVRDLAYDDLDFEAEEQERIARLGDRLLEQEERLGAFSPYAEKARERSASAVKKARARFLA